MSQVDINTFWDLLESNLHESGICSWEEKVEYMNNIAARLVEEELEPEEEEELTDEEARERLMGSLQQLELQRQIMPRVRVDRSRAINRDIITLSLCGQELKIGIGHHECDGDKTEQAEVVADNLAEQFKHWLASNLFDQLTEEED